MKAHDINTNTLSDVTNKVRTQFLPTSANAKNLPNTNNISFDKDVVDIQHAEYSNADNHIKRLDIDNNKQVHIIFSKNDCKMSVRLVAEDGESTTIPKENCPNELFKITTTDVLDKFLENAYVKVNTLDDGIPKLYLFQKCLGGMNNGITPVGGVSVNGIQNGQTGIQATIGVNANLSPSTNVHATVSHVGTVGNVNKFSKPTFGVGVRFNF